MNKRSKDIDKQKLLSPSGNSLFERVVTILERSRTRVVYTVNSEMVLAYWLIGREIVQELQKGEHRAEYGKQIIEELSAKLNRKYAKGFSATNLWYFRQFYVVYSDRKPEILHKACGESGFGKKLHKPCGVLDDLSLAVENSEALQGFSPALSWSHYRTLTKVENKNERMFDDLKRQEDDNPTVGIILCTEKDQTIVKYSVLKENKQLFASKYMLYLPSEEELKAELAREKELIQIEMAKKEEEAE